MNVSGNARVSGNAQVSGDAWVYGSARVCDGAVLFRPDHWFALPFTEWGFPAVYRTETAWAISVGCQVITPETDIQALAESEGEFLPWFSDAIKLVEAVSKTWHEEK